jgi:surface protein
MFNQSQFNGDISLWDVSKVQDMGCMFLNSKFQGDITRWAVKPII